MHRPHSVGTLSLLVAGFALLGSSPPATADAPSAPTSIRWDAKCTEVTLIGTAPGADTGPGTTQLMKGMCPNGMVIPVAQGNCWD